MAEQSDKCPKCDRKMQRRTTAFESVYFCAQCEKDDLVQAAKLAAKGKPKAPK